MSQVGKRFGQLVVVKSELLRSSGGHPFTKYTLRCTCGREFTLRSQALLRRKAHMCGPCYRAAQQEQATTAGYLHPLRSVWYNMIHRCHYPEDARYAGYGGRGIFVCDRWRGEDRGEAVYSQSGFEAFLEDMPPRPSDAYSLERIDNNAGYSPSNCTWATVAEQAVNKRNVVVVTVAGTSACVAEWQRALSVAADLQEVAKKYSLSLEQVVAGALAQRALGATRVRWRKIPGAKISQKIHV